MGKKSSFCNSGECIEVAADEYGVMLTKEHSNDLILALDVTRDEFKAFVAGVKAGEFDEFC